MVNSSRLVPSSVEYRLLSVVVDLSGWIETSGISLAKSNVLLEVSNDEIVVETATVLFGFSMNVVCSISGVVNHELVLDVSSDITAVSMVVVRLPDDVFSS